MVARATRPCNRERASCRRHPAPALPVRPEAKEQRQSQQALVVACPEPAMRTTHVRHACASARTTGEVRV